MNTETAERTISVIAEFKEVPKEQITLETSLKDLDLDSLDGLSLIFELEEEFDIMIPDDKALKMKTVGEIIEGIDRLLNQEPMVAEPDKPAETFESDSVPAEGS